MSFSLDNYFGVHATALTLRSQRATMLANNMANADTPNYKAKDIDFSNVLLKQTQSRLTKTAVTHKSHIATNPSNADMSVMYRVPQKASLDGNTVDMDAERGEFTENAIRYQASLKFLNKRITGLISILKGE